MMGYCLWQYNNMTPSSVSVVGYGATTLSGCYNPIWVNTIKVSTSTQTSQEFLNLFKIPKASLKYKKIDIPVVEGNVTLANATQHRYFFNGYPLYSLEGGYFNYCVSVWTAQPVPLSSYVLHNYIYLMILVIVTSLFEIMLFLKLFKNRVVLILKNIVYIFHFLQRVSTVWDWKLILESL